MACTLLDVDSSALDSTFDQLSESADRAQRNLRECRNAQLMTVEFLEILGELESLSAMDPIPL